MSGGLLAWRTARRIHIVPFLGELRSRIDLRAEELRVEMPCLVHGDPTFHNVILGTDQATLID